MEQLLHSRYQVLQKLMQQVYLKFQKSKLWEQDRDLPVTLCHTHPHTSRQCTNGKTSTNTNQTHTRSSDNVLSSPVMPAMSCMNFSAHSGALSSSSSSITAEYWLCQAVGDSVIFFSFSAATGIAIKKQIIGLKYMKTTGIHN